MKSFRIYAFLLLSLSQFSYAASTPAPISCPSISALQSVPIDKFENLEGNGWFGIVQSNAYQTNNFWTFVLLIPASNENEAKQNGPIMLNQLTRGVGPEVYDEKYWRCRYYDNRGDFFPIAVAITPPDPILNLRIIRN